MTLSDTVCRTAHKSPKAKEGKAFKLFDDKGLFLLVKPASNDCGKRRRFKYRFDGKEKLLSIGTYPEVSLAQAREKRDAGCRHVDPGENRKAIKEARAESTANSFEVIARGWGSKKVETWGEKHIPMAWQQTDCRHIAKRHPCMPSPRRRQRHH